MLPRRKRFDVKDLSNHLGKTISIIVQMEPKKRIKHVELGLCTKRKTGSRRFITWLNRLGHCISYNEVNLAETSIAEEQINNFSTAAFVPSKIRSSEFVAFVYENRDINIESIYNKSYHCKNAIAFPRHQYLVLSDCTEIRPCNPEKMVLKLGKNLSSQLLVIEPIEPATKKVRSDPSLVSSIDINNGLIHEAVAITEDLLWWMLRM